MIVWYLVGGCVVVAWAATMALLAVVLFARSKEP